jgi:predicted MFS family arabinose efflux permease
VTALLLIYGAAGFAGNFIGGQLVGRSARLGMVVTALLLAAALAMSTLVGDGLVAGVLVVVAWGMAFGMVPVSATGWMLKALPEAPEAGQAMLVTAFQVAIASAPMGFQIASERRSARGFFWTSARIRPRISV